MLSIIGASIAIALLAGQFVMIVVAIRRNRKVREERWARERN